MDLSCNHNKHVSEFVRYFREQFRQYFRSFWSVHRFYIVLFMAGLFSDALTTIYFMSRQGCDAELHPLYRLAGHVFGPLAGCIICFLWKVLAGFYIAVFLRRWAAYFFVTVAIISFWAAWYNIWGIKIYTANIVTWFPHP